MIAGGELKDEDGYKKLAHSIAEFWLDGGSESAVEKLENEILKLKYSHPAGRMNVIAIPRDVIENEKTCFVYRSHVLGFECRCESRNHEKFLSDLREHYKGNYTKCASQYRILTHPLDADVRVLTFTFDSMHQDAHREEYTRQLQNVVDFAHALNAEKLKCFENVLV